MTPRLADGVTSASLAQEGTGVVLLTAGVVGGTCRQAGLDVGKRESDGTYSLVRGIVINPEKAPIAEIKLLPGEYHIVTFSCTNIGKTAVLREKQGLITPTFKKSYATFTVNRGEVVNIGSLRVQELGGAQGFVKKTIEIKLEVSDWSEAEKAAFIKQRPALYAQMRTRLMRLDASTIASGE